MFSFIFGGSYSELIAPCAKERKQKKSQSIICLVVKFLRWLDQKSKIFAMETFRGIFVKWANSSGHFQMVNSREHCSVSR